jgi:DNA-binding MarR family transcriptional regulator
VPSRASASPIDTQTLALTHLAYFVGSFANRQLLAEMKRAGYGDLREPHGYLFQHLLAESRSVGQLSKLLGVSQQAVSKTVAELTAGGYLETEAGDDARVRLVRLSRRGHASVLASRRLREKLERRLASKLGQKRAAALRAALAELLQELGGTEAVKGRRVPLADSAAKG